MAYEMTHAPQKGMENHHSPMPHRKPNPEEPVTRDELVVYDAL